MLLLRVQCFREVWHSRPIPCRPDPPSELDNPVAFLMFF